MDQTPTTPITGPLRWAIAVLLLGSLAAMFWGNAEHRLDLQFGGLAALAILLVWFAIYRKQRAARDPDFAARLKEQQSVLTPLGRMQRRRMLMLKILGPMLLLSLPIWYGLHLVQPNTPILQDMRSADLQRLALAGGLVVTGVGHGLRWLLRRGDSGAGS